MPTTGRLILAPMEGLADATLRGVLTAAGTYDWCVTEFVRVTGTRLPRGCFTRISPELNAGSKTQSGTPTRVQLLGSCPEMMAINAERLATLSPAGIDLNFGCPAPQVNRHRGGAALLGEPELLQSIVQAVRAAVPAHIPVTAKMRLGIDDTSRALACAMALCEGGAESLVVHARTKADAYRPPARWEWLMRIREQVSIPVIANGDVWTVADYHRIREVSGCADVMIGRGAVSDPMLVNRIRASLGGQTKISHADAWAQITTLIAVFWERINQRLGPHHTPGRLKQWLGLMKQRYPEAELLYQQVRPLREAGAVTQLLMAQGVPLSAQPQPAAA